jgi:hypothetical protein
LEVVPEDESSSESCLHCDINEVVREHIEGKDTVNLPELVAKMGESLIELILLGPEEQWANLLAEAIRDIGDVFLEKSGRRPERYDALMRCRGAAVCGSVARAQ